MSQCTKRRKPSFEIKPKKSHWDSLRDFLSKNLDIIAVIFMLLTLLFWIWSSYTRSRPETQRKPRFEVEQPPSKIPVRPANVEEPVSRLT